ncbi:hypothetical protein IJU97_02215 [bacterium]|nr:hypothetical protein [bacterium]
MTSNPLEAAKNMGSNLVSNTVQLGQSVGQQATELGTTAVTEVKSTAE